MTQFGVMPRIEAPKKVLPRFDDPIAKMKADAKAAKARWKKMDRLVTSDESPEEQDQRYAFYLKHVSDTKFHRAFVIGNNIGMSEFQCGQAMRQLFERGLIDREKEPVKGRWSYRRNEKGRKFIKKVLG